MAAVRGVMLRRNPGVDEGDEEGAAVPCQARLADDADGGEGGHAGAGAGGGEREAERGAEGGAMETARESGPTLVQRRIRVWWSGNNAWFTGTVRAFSSHRGHCIEYDDGEVKYHTLDDGDEIWELVPRFGDEIWELVQATPVGGGGAEVPPAAASTASGTIDGGTAAGTGGAEASEGPPCGSLGCTLPNRHRGLCRIAPVPSKRPRAAAPMRYGVPLLQEQEKLQRTTARGVAFGSAAPKSVHEERAMLARALTASAAEARSEIAAVERCSARDAAAASRRERLQPDGSLLPGYVDRKLWPGAAAQGWSVRPRSLRVHLCNGQAAYFYNAPCGSQFSNRWDALASAEARSARAAGDTLGGEEDPITHVVAESDDDEEAEEAEEALRASPIVQASRSGERLAGAVVARDDEAELSDDEEEGIGRCMIWG